MPRMMIHFTFYFFTLTALSGVWMRFYTYINTGQAVPYTHLLHAHSHVAILGWTFLGVFILFLAILKGRFAEKQATFIGIAIFSVTTCMFIAFLYQGYALYSIILSTLHIFIEYWVAIFIFIHVRKNQDIPKVSRQFIYGALIMLVISSMGPFSLGAIASLGLRDSPFFDMAIYFYLHFQYNGWLYLVLVGMFLFILHQKGITFSTKKLTYSFWIYFIALFPGYLLSVLWYDFGIFGIIMAVIGGLGQLGGVLLFIAAWLEINSQIKQCIPIRTYYLLTLVITLLGVKSVSELALMYAPFAQLIYETRSVVIGYLHLTLLGFISLFMISQFLLADILKVSGNHVRNALYLFLGGFFLNEIVLFVSGLLTWSNKGSFPMHNHYYSERVPCYYARSFIYG